MHNAGAVISNTKAPLYVDSNRLRNQLFILFILSGVFFWNILSASSGRIIAGYDTLCYHYYAHAFTKEALLRGMLPNWNPYEYAGMPFAADPGNSVFYPLNKFFLFMPISKAISLSMVFHIFLAGAGMLLLARTIGLKRGGGMIAAIAFMFGGYFVDRVAAGQEYKIMGSAYLPWIFLCFERASQRNELICAFLGGVLVGLQILTGALQFVFYTGLFVFVYVVVKNIQMDPGQRLKLLNRDFGYLVLMGVIGTGLSAIQLFPAIELVQHSVREQTSAALVGSMSFPPKNLIHFLLPYVDVGSAVNNWEFTCYVGILPLALALTVLFSIKGREERAFVVVGVLALLIMLGSYTPAFPVLFRIPGLRLFRIHGRAGLGLITAISILAGFGWEKVFEATSNEYKKATRGLVLTSGALLIAVLIVLCLFLLKRVSLSFTLPSPSKLLGFLVNSGGVITSLRQPNIFLPVSAVLITFVASIFLLSRRDACMKYLLAGFMVIDLFALSLGRIRLHDLSYITCEDTLIKSIKADTGNPYFRVWLPLNAFFGSRAKFVKIFNVNGHNALGLRIFEEYLGRLAGVRQVRMLPYYEMHPRIFEQKTLFLNNVLNVKYFSTIQKGEEPIFYVADSCFPRALFVSKYVIGRPDDFFSAGIDVKSTVMLHEEPPPGQCRVKDGDMTNAVVEIVSYGNDEIELSVDAPSDGFVVVSEVYYPGWQAEVDGISARVLRGNFLLRVVPITKGRHTIRLFFAPRSLRLGALISAATIVFIVGALLYVRARAVRFPSPATLASAKDTQTAPSNRAMGSGLEI